MMNNGSIFYKLTYGSVQNIHYIDDADKRKMVFVPASQFDGKDSFLTLYDTDCDELGSINRFYSPMDVEHSNDLPIKYIFNGKTFELLSQNNGSGGKVSYYKVSVENPLDANLEPYVAEFEDIALSLQLNPMEYNIMKDLWRNANARANNNGKPGNTQLRTYQKAVHYSNLLLKLEQNKE